MYGRQYNAGWCCLHYSPAAMALKLTCCCFDEIPAIAKWGYRITFVNGFNSLISHRAVGDFRSNGLRFGGKRNWQSTPGTHQYVADHGGSPFHLAKQRLVELMGQVGVIAVHKYQGEGHRLAWFNLIFERTSDSSSESHTATNSALPPSLTPNMLKNVSGRTRMLFKCVDKGDKLTPV